MSLIKRLLTFFVVARLYGMDLGQGEPCRESWDPCTCVIDAGEFNVNCTNASIEDVVAALAEVEPIDITNLYLTVTVVDNTLPDSMLGSNRAENIYIQGKIGDDSQRPKLKVDQDAFESSSNVTHLVSIDSCDLSELSFQFMTNLINIEALELLGSSKILLSDFLSLPPLPNLIDLTISRCSGLEMLLGFPKFVNGLQRLDMQMNDDLADSGVLQIVVALLNSSKDSLQTLKLNGNGLSVYPKNQIREFTRLEHLDFHGNIFEKVLNRTLTFVYPMTFLDLSFCGIYYIQTGAFNGNFSWATIDLSGNNLIRFRQSTFELVLQQMVQMSPNGGSMNVAGNPFNCEILPNCTLGWLIRDEPELLTVLNGASCSDGTSFQELDPNGFGECVVVIPSLPFFSTSQTNTDSTIDETSATATITASTTSTTGQKTSTKAISTTTKLSTTESSAVRRTAMLSLMSIIVVGIILVI